MNITVDFDYIEDKQPEVLQHIVVTDGYFFRSGIWIDGGYFIPDPDRPFEFIFWTTTGGK